MRAVLDERLPRVRNIRTELLEWFLADACELCGSKVNVEAHHTRRLTGLQTKGRAEKPEWAKMTAARRRKPLGAGRRYHEDIHTVHAQLRTARRGTGLLPLGCGTLRDELPGMEPHDVLAVIACFRRAGIRAYIGGGWGVDALAGEQSRPHADLDVSFDARHEEQAIQSLRQLGLDVVTDQRPVRFIMSDGAARAVDLHPVVFDQAGAGVQSGFGGTAFRYPADGFTTGRIAGEPVPCLSAALQVRFHTGYPPTEKDRHDMQVLHDRLGVPLPAPYA